MGGRKPTVSDYDIIEYIESSEDPFVTTKEIADYLGFSSKHAGDRLQRLEEEGLLSSKRVGVAPAWWLTESGEALLEGELVENDLDIVGEDDLEDRDRPS